MTIYDIKRLHLESHPDSHFFDRKTMSFFGQTLRSFHIKKLSPIVWRITAPMIIDGHIVGYTERVFNTITFSLLSGKNF